MSSDLSISLKQIKFVHNLSSGCSYNKSVVAYKLEAVHLCGVCNRPKLSLGKTAWVTIPDR